MKTISLICVFVLTVASCLAQSVNDIGLMEPWKVLKSEAGKTTYGLSYSGSNWPNLVFTRKTDPDAAYVVKWQLKASSDSADRKAFGVKIDGASGPVFSFLYPVSKEWTECSAYFNSEGESSVKIALFANQNGESREIEVKDVSFEKVSEEKMGGNLLPDGDFENAPLIPSDWVKSSLTPVSPASIVTSKGYISGERTLQLDFLEGKDVPGIQSIYLPVILGKEVEVRFWAKAEGSYAVAVAVDGWPFMGSAQGKHFYKMSEFKLSEEWKEYVMNVAIPSDLSVYPDLRHKLVYLRINGQAGKAGKVFVDGMSFKIVN